MSLLGDLLELHEVNSYGILVANSGLMKVRLQQTYRRYPDYDRGIILKHTCLRRFNTIDKVEMQ